MSLSVRHYTPSDFPLISSWWIAHGEPGPLPSMLPPESTFLLEMDGIPALCVSLYLTNSSEVAYIENFCGNPELDGPARRSAAPHLVKYIENFALSRGYARLFCLAHKEPLKRRYEELGYTRTLDNVATFCKSLK